MFRTRDSLEAPDRGFAGHRDILVRSLARYRFSAQMARGVTLDIGCGRGYGLEVVRSEQVSWIGIDSSFSFLEVAHKLYPDGSFMQASGEHIPIADSSCETILALEVIEHIDNDVGFLHEIRRVICDDGVAAISTPNKRIASANASVPLNPFHAREYSAIEFLQLLQRVFVHVDLFGQSERTASRETKPDWIGQLIDQIPARWKYILSANAQGLLSVALRRPVTLDECQFDAKNVEDAHTFVAICRP